VNVGHTYTVGPGDEMQQIARKFGMTTEAIYGMNYDVSGTQNPKNPKTSTLMLNPDPEALNPGQ
jgi:LysM repeat protein